jgi:Maltose operon periplasmic protein precursor (MalM)
MSLTNLALTTATAALFCLSGCATTGSRQIETFDNRLSQAKTVTRFGELPQSVLPMGESVTVQLGAETTDSAIPVAIQLGDEASFVRVFKLPDWQGPYSIQVTSFTYGGLADPAIFYPRYVLLDKNARPTRHSVARDFVYRGAGVQGAISTTVFINEENRDEALVAILSEPRRSVVEQTSLAQSAGTSPLIVPVRGGALMWLIPMGGQERPKPMRAAAGGQVLIKAEAYKPKRIEAKDSATRQP